MIQKFARRHWIALLLFFIVMGSMAFPWQVARNNGSTIRPPAQAIMKQAVVIDQGVQIEWVKSQPGTYPISGYIIERNRDGDDFKRIARVERVSLKYLDAEGRAGDVYRVITEDDQRLAGRSPASEQVVAAPAKPGSVVVVESDVPTVLGTSTPDGLDDSPGTKTAALQDLATKTFDRLDADLTANASSSVGGHLTVIQEYQRQILSLLPQTTPAQKASLAQACATQMQVFETNLHILPEEDQLDGMLVLAGCTAIQEGAT